MSDTLTKAKIRSPRRMNLSPVWLVPLVAALIGAWLLYRNIASQGPEIVLRLDNAEGVEAGKTVVKLHNVDVGLVEKVRLSKDYTGAVAEIRMKADMDPLLVKDTQFWVVKPRVGREGISGLNTILSGAYIQMRPGNDQSSARHFKALDQPPTIRTGAAGLSLELISTGDISLTIGDPIVYQGQEVGRIDSAEFNAQTLEMHYGVLIRAPFDKLITQNTQFWPRFGIAFEITSEGVRVQTGTLEAMLAGGVTFGAPPKLKGGKKVQQGAKFRLYPSRQIAQQDRYDHQYKYVILFDDSVRGLYPGATVEFRGVRVGTVLNVPFFGGGFGMEYSKTFRIPVLIAFEPQRLTGTTWAQLDQKAWQQQLSRLFPRGLRATIKTANLFTGAMFVDLAFTDQKSAHDEAGFQGQYPLLPSHSSGLANIEEKATRLLGKLDALELAPVLTKLQRALESTSEVMNKSQITMARLNSILGGEAMRELPAEFNATLDELRKTLHSYQQGAPVYDKLNRSLGRLNQVLDDLAPFVETLHDAPSALFFGGNAPEDPIPQAAK
ncbi:intermembrane transport protein PqiB [Nitrosococcus watsonii]|uniref:Mammalian cell entry related domain protein n=1 Tax=Nitrosococcus watsoni (strain C-113) TaxID=105559 RepID=D8KBC3_NITWC|nr:intermembrane transport protein PqiB [Nitrosococcus watsonii]ADJ29570.1 Mammalian cell entry related domain protein [Nitrosococcus watsonii C-113]